MIKPILLSIAIISLLSVSAQDFTERHPIDVQLEACHDNEENQTTKGMMNCEAEARKAWDAELNKYYKLLLAELTDDQKTLLRESQRQWITYRDAEFNFSNALHYRMQGTMWRVIGVQRSTEIVRTRALELRDYYLTLTESR